MQSPWRDRRVVIEQSHTHECLARFIKITALELDIARQETRLSVHLSLRLKHHDLLGDLLRVVRLMSGDLHLTKLQQHFGFSRRIGRDLQIFAERGLRFVELLLFGGSVAKIKPKIRFDRGIVDLSKHAEIFLGGGIIFLVVIINSQPLQDFGRDRASGIGREKAIDFSRDGAAIMQTEIRRNDADCRLNVIAILIQLTRRVEGSQRGLVILHLKRGFADVVMRHRRGRAFRKFF